MAKKKIFTSKSATTADCGFEKQLGVITPISLVGTYNLQIGSVHLRFKLGLESVDDLNLEGEFNNNKKIKLDEIMKIISPIFCDFQGKLGDAVAQGWKDKHILRSRSLSVNDPKTPAQLKQRAKMATTVAFLHPITGFVNIGYKTLATSSTAYNCATSQIIKHAITGTYPDYQISYKDVVVARGTLSPLQGTAVSVTTAGFRLSWTDSSAYDQNANASDVIMYLVYNPDKGEAIYETSSSVTRADGSITITYPTSWSGDETHLYISAHTSVGSDQFAVADSRYLGSFTAI